MNEYISYSEDLRLKTSYFDEFDNIKPDAILGIFQDIAGIHADNLHIGFKDLYEKGYYWILARVRFDILKKPTPLSMVHVKTWPHEIGRVDAKREYEITDLNGDVLIRGLAKWVIIDINTRRLARMSNISYGEGLYLKANYEDVEKIELPELSKFKKIYTYKVLKSDLDHNKHMNNCAYAKILFESTNHFIKNLTVDYFHELNFADTIDLYEYNNFYIGMKDNTIVFSMYTKVE